MRPARRLGLILLAWLGFFALQAAIWLALMGPRSLTPGELGLRVVVQAAGWTLLSVVVARWHARLRGRAGSLPAIALQHAPLFLLVVLADYAMLELAELASRGARPYFWATVIWNADQYLACYVAIVAVAELLAAGRSLGRRERENRRLESLVGRARLDFLEAQLQPHFLFNTLSAVSELASQEPESAGRVLDQLIAGLTVSEGRGARKGEVTLAEELAELDSYLGIQRMRFADWLAISVDVAPAARACLVPRFVVQPLVENAIRHGLTDRTLPGAIAIAARVEGEDLVLSIADNGVGHRPGAAGVPDGGGGGRSGHGIGLGNVRQRLAILYGARAAVRLVTSGAGTTAELRLPARRSAPGAEPEPAAEEAPRGAEPRPLRLPAALRRPAVAIPAIWALCGLAWTQQAYLYLVAGNPLEVRTWLGLARLNFGVAAVWAVLTPALLLVGGRVVGRVRRVAWRIAAAAAVCAGATVVHVVLFWLLTNRGDPLLAPGYQGTAAVDLGIATIIIALAQRGALLRWLRRSDAEAAALAAELEGERRRAVEVQALPRVLVGALETIRAAVRTDAARAESQIARLGDELRAALEAMAERVEA